MRKLRFYFSLLFARITYFILRTTKLSGGTAIIGMLVLKLCPDFLFLANELITKKKINISGTNGKTTTSGLIGHILKNHNQNVVNNAMGANMLTGIVNALSIQLNPLKKADYSVI